MKNLLALINYNIDYHSMYVNIAGCPKRGKEMRTVDAEREYQE
jgi:hypothetical protein